MPFKPLKKQIFDIPFFARLLRYRFLPEDFLPHEKLYRGFRKSDLIEETGELAGNSFTFPDKGGISLNWSRFSKPEDIRKRKNGLPTDGCFSITVEQARYKGKASTCHDPFPSTDPKNYAHMEIRQLLPTEDLYFEPPKDRKKLKKEIQGWPSHIRLAYRQYISISLIKELEPLD